MIIKFVGGRYFMKDLFEYIPNTIWIKEYSVCYAGTKCNSRMTIIRLLNNNLLLHSPCEIDEKTKIKIEQLGGVEFIIAPGSYHYLHLNSAQKAFPNSETLLCPGIETKIPSVKFDWMLGDIPDTRLTDDFEQILIRGNKYIWEVAFYQKTTKTLILVDLIENFTHETEDTNWLLRIWFKLIFRMWNNPKPAPEYQLGWKNNRIVSQTLKKILDWNFERVILSHGDLIEVNAKEVVYGAWKNLIE